MAPETARQERKPADLPRLKALLAPYPSGQITCWSVSARVGNVKNNDPSLIEPIAVNEPKHFFETAPEPGDDKPAR